MCVIVVILNEGMQKYYRDMELNWEINYIDILVVSVNTNTAFLILHFRKKKQNNLFAATKT